MNVILYIAFVISLDQARVHTLYGMTRARSSLNYERQNALIRYYAMIVNACIFSYRYSQHSQGRMVKKESRPAIYTTASKKKSFVFTKFISKNTRLIRHNGNNKFTNIHMFVGLHVLLLLSLCYIAIECCKIISLSRVGSGARYTYTTKSLSKLGLTRRVQVF